MSAPELRDVLDEVGRRGVAGSALGAAELEAHICALTRQARRRRVVRGSAVVTGAAAAVVVGALAVQGVEGRRPVPPVDSPSPTVQETPRPSPSAPEPAPDGPVLPTPDPDPEPLGGVTVHPALPSALPLLEGMLEASTDEWHLVTLSPIEVPGAPDAPVVYLVGPDGQRYEVPSAVDLTAGDDDPMTTVGIEAWLPGSSLVLVLPWAGGSGDGGVQGHQVVDLLTGEVVGDVPVPEREWPSITFVGDGSTDLLVADRVATYDETPRSNGVRRITADGREVARYGAFTYADGPLLHDALISPDRTRVLVSRAEGMDVLAGDDLAVLGTVPSPVPEPCGAWAWWDDRTALVACGEETVRYTGSATGTVPDTLWAVPLDGAPPRLLTGEVGAYDSLAVLDDRVLLGEYGATGAGPWTAFGQDGTATPLSAESFAAAQVRQVVGTTGTRLVLQVVLDPEALTESLVALDPFTGESLELVPNPAGAVSLRVARGVA